MKKNYNKISLLSKFVNNLLKKTSLKKDYLTEESTKKLIKRKSKKNYFVPEQLGLYKEQNKKMRVYSYNGSLSNPKKKIIIYMHGGSYVEEAVAFQIKFAMKIAKKSKATLIFPVYPLAPKHTYIDTYDLMLQLYEKLIETNKELIFLGDSAGGGFSLSFSMFLRDKKIKLPKKVLLLSPWLDITLENPEAKKKEKLDTTCAINGNIYAGKLWAGDLDNKNYLVSPIYGSFEELPEITIATGEYDTMQPDCIKLSKKLDKKNINHNFIEYKGQGHDFGIYPTYEGKLLINDFVKIIKEENSSEK